MPKSIVSRLLTVYLLITFVFPVHLHASDLQRIIVEKSNNHRLSNAYQRMFLPTHIDSQEMFALKAYAGLKIKPRQRDEMENLLAVAVWVHQRWKHDPYGIATPDTTALEILQRAEQGARFSCTEYSKVLRDLYRAHGYVARLATLQAPDIAYSGLGTAHVAVEVYSSRLDKWIFIDPQWGLYPQHRGLAINLYEYFQLKSQGRQKEVHFVPLKKGLLSNAEQEAVAYREFLHQHLGYLSVDLTTDEEQVHVLLAMEGRSWPLTFQGLPRNAQIYSSDPQDLYFDMNRVSLVLNFRYEAQPLSRLNIDYGSEQEYLQKMPMFAAVPDFIVHAHNNMPWFSHYIYRTGGGKWKTVQQDSWDWTLHKGENLLEVRAVNTQGIMGPTTFFRIYYGR